VILEKLLLGLDLGMSTAKAGLFTATGRQVALASEEYLQIPEGVPVLEADAELFWRAVCAVIREALAMAGAGSAERVAGVSISSHAETLIILGEDGQTVRPAILSPDSRAEQEAAELTALVGNDWILERTAQPEITAMWPACKLAWLKRHEPDSLAAATHILLPPDFIIYRLCGAAVGEAAAWLSSVMLDITSQAWLAPVLDYAGVRQEQLPQLLAPGTLAGRVTAQAAAETGLAEGTPVAVGCMDQICAGLAAGNVRPGIVTASTGSVLALMATTPAPVFDHVTKIPAYPHAVPGLYCLLPWNPTGGMVLKWYKDRFGQLEEQQAQGSGASVYDLLTGPAAEVPPGCDGLTMVPHLQGVLFPEVNPAARGAFIGFSLMHTKAHFTRAILEAIAYMLRSGVECLRGLGVNVEEVRVLGGGARNRLWNQIMADVCQVPIATPANLEAAVLGAAMLAAVGAGVVPDALAAAEMMVGIAGRYLPDVALAGVYGEGYTRYNRLYQKLYS